MFHDIKSYARDFLKVVRNCEATAKKLARFRNHLRLTLRWQRTVNRDEGSYTLSHTYDHFLATSHHYRGKNRKKKM